MWLWQRVRILKMPDRIFKFESVYAKHAFCTCIATRFNILFNRYHIFTSEYILVNLHARIAIDMRPDVMATKPYKLVTDEFADAMDLIVDDDTLIQFVFK